MFTCIMLKCSFEYGTKYGGMPCPYVSVSILSLADRRISSTRVQ